MGFCTECGTPLKDNHIFCPECGKKLTVPVLRTSNSPPQGHNIPVSSPVPLPSINRHELGNKLEEVVEAIFKADGYSTQRRQRVQGVVRGYTNEIDIMATRGNDRVAIECKNHTSPVGIAQVRDFAEKIVDLGVGWRGVFVGYSDFSEDASAFAQCRNIEQMGHDEVMEQWFALSVGRTPNLGEKLVIENVLPLTFDFTYATALTLVNKDKVQVMDAKLVFHPYIRFMYSFSRKWRDPSKETHDFNDQGMVVIDLLNNELMNPPVVKDLGSVTKALVQSFSSKGSQENYQRKIIFREVAENRPLSEITRTRGEEYQIQKLAVEYAKRDVNHTAIDYIIEKNTHLITYTVDSKNSFSPFKTAEFVPKREDITLKTGEIIFVPKWTIHFNAFGSVYTREMLACSGQMLEDTIAYCPLHFKLGALQVNPRNTGVCEKCGRGFCSSHGRQCEVCKVWLCDFHSVQCSSCKRVFCREHIPKTCGVCGKDMCTDCVLVCPVCGKEYGMDHAVRCNTCDQFVCGSCATISGILKKVTTCKRCQLK